MSPTTTQHKPLSSILSDVGRKKEKERIFGDARKKKSIVEFNLENMDGDSSGPPSTKKQSEVVRFQMIKNNNDS